MLYARSGRLRSMNRHWGNNPPFRGPTVKSRVWRPSPVPCEKTAGRCVRLMDGAKEESTNLCLGFYRTVNILIFGGTQFRRIMPSFPHYLQPDAMDCGSTCLRIVARYFGKHYNLGTIREMTFQTREGVSLLTLSDAAEKIGFRTQGARLPLSGLGRAPLPAILHWDQNHYVVLYKIRKRKNSLWYWISDPAAGQVAMPREEFLEHWATSSWKGEPAGIALLLEPTPAFFREEGEPLSVKGAGFFASYLRPYRKLIFQLLLGFATGSLLSLLFPFLTQAIVDIGISNNNLSFIVLVLVAQLVLIVSQTAVGFLRSWIMLHISARVSISLISDFLIRLMRLPVRFFDIRLAGDLRQRIEDNTRVQHLLTSSLVNMSFGLFLFLIYSLVLAWYHWKILLLFLLGSGLYAGWVMLFMKRRRQLDQRRFEAQAANQQNLYQLITGMQEIKLNNCGKQKRWDWELIQTRLFRVGIRSLMLNQYQQAGAVLINQTKNILIVFMAAAAVLRGDMTLGMLVAVHFIIGQMNAPLQEFLPFVTSLQDARLSLERLDEINSRESGEPVDAVKIRELPASGEIRVDNVTFRYEGPRSPKVLEGISLRLPQNGVTALVGPSGSGKTTLMKLILGFYPPTEGQVSLGGLPLDRYDSGSYWRHCGVVMQEGFLFSDTIAGNIAPGIENPDLNRLREAAVIAGLEETIENLPLRFSTRIGPEGTGLSQGQKQRILIARAVYKNPAFLFLDEATNALDATNEKQILARLREFFQNRTVLVIAHRLSTVVHADHIVLLSAGRITERGTHRELVELKGDYYRLVKDQLELGS